MFSGKIFYNFAFVALCGVLQTHFSPEGLRPGAAFTHFTILALSVFASQIQLSQRESQEHCRKGAQQKSTAHFCAVLFFLVEITGIEPVTSCMPCKRSPS